METYKQVGGVRFGFNFWLSLNYTWPLAVLTANEDCLEIRVARRQFKLHRAEIERIEKCRGIFASGIRIHHKSGSLPVFLAFWSTNIAALQENLLKRGYPLVGF